MSTEGGKMESSASEYSESESDYGPSLGNDLLEPPITLEEVEKLLPGSLQVPGWSIDDERRLQATWTDKDQVVLEKHTDEAIAELLLWKRMFQLFRRHPWHLFRYGLKYGSTSPYIPPGVCEDLSTLICHPIWEGDIARLRYVLQVAIKCRLQGHVEPIAPLRPTKDEDVLRADLTRAPGGRELAGRMLASLYHTSHPCKNLGISFVCDVLERTVLPDTPDFNITNARSPLWHQG